MVANVTQALNLQLSVDLKRFEKALKRAEGAVNKNTRAIEKGFDNAMGKVEESSQRMSKSVNRAFAAISVGVILRQAQTLSDEWVEATNKIAAAQEVFGGSLAGTEDIVGIANRARQGFEPIADLYARLARAAGELNIAETQVAQTTETLAKAFKAGGAAVSEQYSAILQLTQGIASGALQGDELRTVRESAPLVAKAIADELGVTIGELKKLGSEGKVTADVIFRAIENSTQIIERQFEQTNETIAESFVRLRNNLGEFVGTSDTFGNAAATIQGAVRLVADNLDLMADAAIIAATAFGGAKLGGAMLKFVTVLKATNTQLAAAVAIQNASVLATGKLTKASLAASISITKLKTAFRSLLAAGGLWIAAGGLIAVGLVKLVQSYQQARKEQAAFSRSAESVALFNERVSKELEISKKLLSDNAAETANHSDKVEDLSESYETAAEAAERLNKAEKERQINLAKENAGAAQKNAENANKIVAERLRLLKEERQEERLSQGVPSFQGESLEGSIERIRGQIQSGEGRGSLFFERRQKALREELHIRLELNKSIKDAEKLVTDLQSADSSVFSSDSGSDLEAKQRQKLKKELEDTNAIALAREAGDTAEINRIKDKIFLEEQLAKERKIDADGAEERAKATLSAFQSARKTREDGKGKKRNSPEEIKYRKEILELETAIDLAEANGNETAARGLELDKERLQLVRKFKDAGKTDAQAEAAAEQQIRALIEAEKISLELKRDQLDRINAIAIARAENDEATVAALEREIELERLAAQFREAGQSETQSRRSAEGQVKAVEDAEAETMAREVLIRLKERELQIDLEAASLRGDGTEVRRLGEELEIRSRINELRRIDVTLTEDQARVLAEEELQELKIAEAIRTKSDLLLEELEFKALLAQQAGNTAEEDRLQREIDLLRRKRDLLEQGRDPSIAEDEQVEIDEAEFKGQVKRAASGAFRAAVDGEFGDYLSDKLSSAADKMFDRALDNLIDVLFNQIDFGGLLGGGGSGGGILGGLTSVFAGLFDGGGTIRNGEFGIVGERGPEIVQGPATVTSRRETSRILSSRPDMKPIQSVDMGGQSVIVQNTFRIDGVDTQQAFEYADRKAAESYTRAMSDTDKRTGSRRRGFAR